jgi:UDPglucose--hexose-1-phosphate uridylyltransferase
MTPGLRICPATGRAVLIAPERAARPLGLADAKPHARQNIERDRCPFCPGEEHDTPDAVQAWPDAANWRVRTVPNKFPAVRPHGGPGHGRHWVVIEGRHHATHPGELRIDDLAQSILAYRDGIALARQDPRLQYVQIFKNVGTGAGASLAHSHSQLIATDFVPDELRREFDHNINSCAYCRIDSDLMIIESEHFLAYCPFAPRFGYEVWVQPRRHESRFETITERDSLDLALVLQGISNRLDAAVGDPAYNWVLHTAPLREPRPHFHWHIEILPRIARAAGYEWGTGVFINAVPPESAAALLRSVNII